MSRTCPCTVDQYPSDQSTESGGSADFFNSPDAGHDYAWANNTNHSVADRLQREPWGG